MKKQISAIKKFKRLVGPTVWRNLLLSSFIGLAWFGVEFAFIFILQGFLHAIGVLDDSKFSVPNWFPEGLVPALVILFLFGLVRAIIFMFKSYVSNKTQLEFTCSMRSRFFSFGLRNAQSIPNKDLISIFTDVIGTTGSGIHCISSLIIGSVTVCFFFLSGLKIAPVEMTLGVSLLAVLVMPIKLLNKRINNSGQGTITEWSSLSDSLLRGMKNNFLLTIYKQIDSEILHGNERLKAFMNHHIQYALACSLISVIPSFIGVTVLSFITYISITYTNTTPANLISFFYLFVRLSQASSELSSVYANLRFTTPGFKLLYHWYQTFEESEKSSKQTETVHFNQRDIIVRAEDLSFGYDDAYLFSNLNFKVTKGEMLLIKGESGSGKSTLLSLILGFLKTQKGKVLINDISLNNIKLDMHEVLAYVGPEPFMIQGSVKDNLVYGQSRDCVLNDEEVWSCLKEVQLFETISNLKLGLNEQLGDIAQLSTGQKQRLSLARALLRKPALLILDEATANLDVATEKIILTNINNFLVNTTTIVVSHKDTFDAIATHKIDLNKFRKDQQ